MNQQDDFKKFANKHMGISSMSLQRYTSIWGNYISPTIIEERQLNIATMDVFSRLMMDRIIFLGEQVNDVTASLVVAQMLFLESDEVCETSYADRGGKYQGQRGVTLPKA